MVILPVHAIRVGPQAAVVAGSNGASESFEDSKAVDRCPVLKKEVWEVLSPGCKGFFVFPDPAPYFDLPFLGDFELVGFGGDVCESVRGLQSIFTANTGKDADLVVDGYDEEAGTVQYRGYGIWIITGFRPTVRGQFGLGICATGRLVRVDLSCGAGL